jgi:hypothetical protein
MGMARAYSAKADYKKALSYLEIALSQAPDEGSKYAIRGMISKLKEGKDVN